MVEYVTKSGQGAKCHLTPAGEAYLEHAWGSPLTQLEEIKATLGVGDDKVLWRFVREMTLGKKTIRRAVEKPFPPKGMKEAWPDWTPDFQDDPRTVTGRLGQRYIEGEQ